MQPAITAETTREFFKNEKIVFCPVARKAMLGTVLDLPADGSFKYKIQLEDGTIHFVNPCYLQHVPKKS